MNKFLDFIKDKLEVIEKAGWTRSCKYHQPINSIETLIDNKIVYQFCSNDYLGLSFDKRIAEAIYNYSLSYGNGAGASRLVTGSSDLYKELEENIAKFKNREASLTFSSGYMANIGTISALMHSHDVVFSDRFNHSSLKAGINLSKAMLFEYEHLSIEDLKTKLEKHRHSYKNAMIISDFVFSMDGDIADIKSLISLAEEYECLLFLDEAHSTGVFPNLELNEKVKPLVIEMGTFSKAVGLQGGFVVANEKIIDFLIQRSKTFIYSTAMSPCITGGILESLKIIKSEDFRREKLWQNVKIVKDFLIKNNFDLIPSESQILCVKFKNNESVLKASAELFKQGIWISAIRPPTVATPRLRITLSSNHEEKHLERFFDAMLKII